jgi:hypothetical protein
MRSMSHLLTAFAIGALLAGVPQAAKAAWQYENNGPYPVTKHSMPTTPKAQPSCHKPTDFRCAQGVHTERAARTAAPFQVAGRYPSCHKPTQFICGSRGANATSSGG